MAENNPPAFPVHFIDREGDLRSEEYGMTLRDYFAAAALSVLLGKVSDADVNKHGATGCHAMIAQGAYMIAEAMLKERLKLK